MSYSYSSDAIKVEIINECKIFTCQKQCKIIFILQISSTYFSDR